MKKQTKWKNFQSNTKTIPVPKQNTVITPDLALTPSRMAEMVERGLPISSAQDMNLVDGVENPSFNVDVMRQRGIDVADVYMNEKGARHKLVNHMANDINNYGV